VTTAYATYEDVAHSFFCDCKDTFGFDVVERKAVLTSKSGNTYKIEVLGRRVAEGADIIIECKHYGPKSQIDQEMVGGLAYRVQNTGADGAFIVTTHELQSGAQRVADFEQITVFIIGPDATIDDYGVVREIAQGLSRYFLKLQAEIKTNVGLGMTYHASRRQWQRLERRAP
jgi:hypothetical protein